MQRYPQPGCIVEYMEGNVPQIAMVLEGDENRLRLLLPNRREAKLSSSRVLPWLGPCFNPAASRDDSVRILEEHKKKREELARSLPLLEAWEMAQGEIDEALASWFAELFDTNPDEDTVAAFGRGLLNLKSHFRFQPPHFQVYSAETVEKRLYEERVKSEREALIAGGASFLKQLWSIAQSHSSPPPATEWPEEAIAERIRVLLHERVLDPDSQKDEALWNMLVKGMPDVPHLPLQLLIAWGVLPPHYNFWLDRADYERGDEWWRKHDEEVESLVKAAKTLDELPECALPFVSIDSASTHDIDDAFHASKSGNGFDVTIALACPALRWDFEGNLDRAVRKRGTSIYLPEGDLHMLPGKLGLDAYSLVAREARPAFCISMQIDGEGKIASATPALARVSLAANLTYPDVEKILNGSENSGNPAYAFAPILKTGLEVAELRKKRRIDDGAVIMDRQEPKISLEGEGWDTRVSLEEESPTPAAQGLVAEMMIAASAGIADWAMENKLPLLHRTQDVAVPKEYAGIWDKPEDMARVMRALVPSSLEVGGKRHAALALARYAPVTSPLRRYTDLVNEAQVLHFITEGSPLFEKEALEKVLAQINPVLEGAGHAQRFRPRYWKLLYILQEGSRKWWDGIITEENDMAVTVNLPAEGLFVRGKRRLFDERACPGMAVQLRLGKVNPLYNEIQIMEVQPVE